MGKILFEPFKIKSVERLPVSTAVERKKWIEQVGFNLFSLTSDQVTIDLLTDSGTSAMSDQQWAEMLKADESYAGSQSFLKLQNIVSDLTGLNHVIPVHQGRAAEHLLFSTLLEGGELVPSNGFFDTTRANVEARQATALNIPISEGLDPFADHPFKGNIDLEKLSTVLAENHGNVPFVLMTITNNTAGGQPVSLENLTAAAELARRHNALMVIDACRFAENSYFIKTREKSPDTICDLSPREISRKCFDLCDALTFSGKKDALVNIGGLLCVRNAELADTLKEKLILIEGFPTYGGLAGYSLAAMAQGIEEVLDENYLEYRLRTVAWMVERLMSANVPVMRPAGGHAIYLDSTRFFPHISRLHFPGIALAVELYIAGGIRGCELGTVAFGKRDQQGEHILPPLDLVRLALPRRVYTEAHMGFVVETIIDLYERRKEVEGFEFENEYKVLRHFRSTFKRAN